MSKYGALIILAKTSFSSTEIFRHYRQSGVPDFRNITLIKYCNSNKLIK
jgi:hypothetical protein